MTLRVGLLNMMPDRALVTTERQFARLMGRDHGRDLELLRFSFPEMTRSPEAMACLRENYGSASEMRADGLDVLVISGANVSHPILTEQEFWPPLDELLEWSLAADLPTLCSCLATHAVLEARHGQRRSPVVPKIWGVYPHRQVVPNHCLLRGLPFEVPVPHSRHNEVSAEQFVAAGYEVLLASDEAGVHLAVERERGRWLLMQGHPEYEAVSLLKEFKREVLRWQSRERSDYPVPPCGYLDAAGGAMLESYRDRCLAMGADASAYEPFPEAQVVPHLLVAWPETAVRVVANWLEGCGL